jgi:hypothetical protein
MDRQSRLDRALDITVIAAVILWAAMLVGSIVYIFLR